KLARRGLIGLLSAVCIAGLAVAFVFQSSYGRALLVHTQWAPKLISTASLPSNKPPIPAKPDSPPVQVAAADAAPPQAATPQTAPPPTRPQDPATVAPAASEQMQLLQKMTADIATLQQAMQQLKAKQDQIASDSAKAIEQLKAKQEDMARLLARIS